MYENPLREGVKFLLGKGDRIKFWEDVWVVEVSLKERFPHLFNISLDQNSLVKDLGFWDGVIWVWNLRWSRPLRSWKLDQSNSLHSLLNNLNYSPNRSDKLIWVFDNKGVYSVKSAITAAIPSSFPLVPWVNSVW